MGENGEDKLLAMARHIAHTLGHSHPSNDQILQILSDLDQLSNTNTHTHTKSNTMQSDLGSRKLTTPTTCCSSRGSTLTALEHTLKSLHRRISQYVAAPHPIWSDSADSAAFLDSVDELHAAIRHWNSMAGDKSVNACLDRAEDLLQQAMFRLEDEFKTLLQRAADSSSFTRSLLNDDKDHDEAEGEESIPVANPVSSDCDYYDIVIDALPATTIADLSEIAKRMVAAGFGKECSHVYSLCRRDFLEESFSRLGLQKLSAQEVQRMPWAQIEEEIERWTKAALVALRILFPSERRLCDRVFSAASDLSFMEVCRGSTIQLLNFADAVAIGSRSPERLFKILDLFETMRDLMPDFEALFAEDRYCVFLRTESIAIWKRLGDAVRGTFMELENLISRDPPKAPIPGGRLHPITRYVMNYLRAACRSRQTLDQIFDKNYPQLSSSAANFRKPDDHRTAATIPTPLPPPSSVSVQMAWIMELLESNLETKSSLYIDPALCSIFMLNNQRYIVHKVKDSELGSLLGEDWVRKHHAKARLYAANYQRNSWNKALGLLKLETYNGSAANSMRERLTAFNACFEENCKLQSAWVVFDEQMREDLRKTIAGTLVPAYRNFMAKFQDGTESGKQQGERSGRWYRPEEVEAKIGDLFRGSTGSSSSNGGGRK